MAERYLLLPHYTPAGLSNQRMELELKVGLAHLTKRTLVLPDAIEIWRGPHPSRPLRAARAATLTDLFELPPGPITYQEFNQRCPDVTPVSLSWRSDQEDACSAYFVSSSLKYLPNEIVQKFANGRRHAWINKPKFEEQLVVVSAHRMLGWYSYFFLVRQDEFVQLRDLIRQITPKAPYSQYADEVVKSLGRFNALHIRRGDFLSRWVIVPDAREILHNISSLIPRHEPLLICTDSSADKAYFQPFFELFPEACFLDELILQHPTWAARMNDLPFSDEGVLGLLTQLIAAKANVFAGTLFSTFTAYIHRQRLFERDERAFKYVSNPFADAQLCFVDCEFKSDRKDLFTWNRLSYPLPPSVFSWFREWPEALTGPFPYNREGKLGGLGVEVRNLQTTIRDLQAAVDTLIDSPRYIGSDQVGFNGQAVRKEIFSQLLCTCDFQLIVETGTWTGDTTGYMAEASKLPVLSVDSIAAVI